jgi:hypothetical protein
MGDPSQAAAAAPPSPPADEPVDAAAAEAAAVAEEVRAVQAAVDADTGAFAGERLDDMTNIDIIRLVTAEGCLVPWHALSTHDLSGTSQRHGRPGMLHAASGAAIYLEPGSCSASLRVPHERVRRPTTLMQMLTGRRKPRSHMWGTRSP